MLLGYRNHKCIECHATPENGHDPICYYSTNEVTVQKPDLDKLTFAECMRIAYERFS